MKKDSNKQGQIFSLLSLLTLLCFFSCKDLEEGCLDIEATNYDVTADEACPDCCTYPRLRLDVLYKVDSLNMIYDNPYVMENDSVIKITKTKFYISDLRLCNGNEILEVGDRIDLDLINSSQSVNLKDDFTLITRDVSSFTYEIGEIRGTGTFDTLKFFVGLDETANAVDPDLAPEDHALAIQPDSMWSINDAYFFNKLSVVPDTSRMDSIRTFNVFGPEKLIEIALPLEKRVDLGFDVTIRLTVDYKLWFRGIDFVADSESDIIEEIVSNTIDAFIVEE